MVRSKRQQSRKPRRPVVSAAEGESEEEEVFELEVDEEEVRQRDSECYTIGE